MCLGLWPAKSSVPHYVRLAALRGFWDWAPQELTKQFMGIGTGRMRLVRCVSPITWAVMCFLWFFRNTEWDPSQLFFRSWHCYTNSIMPTPKWAVFIPGLILLMWVGGKVEKMNPLWLQWSQSPLGRNKPKVSHFGWESKKSTMVTSVRNNVQESLSLSYALPGVFISLQYDYAAA